MLYWRGNYAYFADIQIEEGTVATAYTPYSEPATYSGITAINDPLRVVNNGKNLIPNDVYDASSYKAVEGFTYPIAYKLPTLEGGKTYTVSFDYSNTQGETYYYMYYRANGTNTLVQHLVTSATQNGRHSHTFVAIPDAEYYFYGVREAYLPNR